MYSVSKLKIMACFWGVIVGHAYNAIFWFCSLYVNTIVIKKCIKMQMSCEFDHAVNKFCLFTEASLGWENLAADPRLHASWTKSGAGLYLFICSSESYQKINLSQAANVSMKSVVRNEQFFTQFMTQNIITMPFKLQCFVKVMDLCQSCESLVSWLDKQTIQPLLLSIHYP